MNTIQAFTSPLFGEIRTYTENGCPFFCLADICRVLGIKNSSDAKTRLNQKGVVTTDTLTNGGMQHITFIDESNLYKLIFQSRKSEAEQFTDWVTGEVLPAIRKHGNCLPAVGVQYAENLYGNSERLRNRKGSGGTVDKTQN